MGLYFGEKIFSHFLFTFFTHFKRDFGLFLKGFEEKIFKKSIFSKMKPHIENPSGKKLDMVPYFTLRALVDHRSKTERQVRK